MSTAAIKHDMGDLSAPGTERLVWQSWSPVEAPRAVLAVLHGFGEHCARYGFLVEDMVPRGYAVQAYDLRGHGRSTGRRGHIDRFDRYLDDTRIFLERMRRRHPLAPVYLLGHSMGGLVAAALAEQDDSGLAGLILSSPFLGMRIAVPPGQLRAARLLSRVVPFFSLDNPLRNEDLSHDPEVVAAAGKDILNHRCASARWATEMIRVMPATVAAADRLRLPLLLLYAGDDPVADPQVAERFFDRAGSKDKTKRRYEGFYHEIFNEVGRAEVFADLAAWLDDRLAGARPRE
jgi:alpha-beta hydrolase superfamily lysophospholipase